MKLSSRFWRRYGLALVAWSAVFSSLDFGLTHEPWFGALAVALGVVSAPISRYNYVQAVRRERHDEQARRPDYAKIARLEKELGVLGALSEHDFDSEIDRATRKTQPDWHPAILAPGDPRRRWHAEGGYWETDWHER